MKKQFTGIAIVDTGWSTKRFSAWSKYGKNRIYITREDGKKTYGYIDLDNNNEVVCDDDIYVSLMEAVEAFLEQYAI